MADASLNGIERKRKLAELTGDPKIIRELEKRPKLELPPHVLAPLPPPPLPLPLEDIGGDPGLDAGGDEPVTGTSTPIPEAPGGSSGPPLSFSGAPGGGGGARTRAPGPWHPTFFVILIVKYWIIVVPFKKIKSCLFLHFLLLTIL